MKEQRIFDFFQKLIKGPSRNDINIIQNRLNDYKLEENISFFNLKNKHLHDAITEENFFSDLMKNPELGLIDDDRLYKVIDFVQNCVEKEKKFLLKKSRQDISELDGVDIDDFILRQFLNFKINTLYSGQRKNSFTFWDLSVVFVLMLKTILENAKKVDQTIPTSGSSGTGYNDLFVKIIRKMPQTRLSANILFFLVSIATENDEPIKKIMDDIFGKNATKKLLSLLISKSDFSDQKETRGVLSEELEKIGNDKKQGGKRKIYDEFCSDAKVLLLVPVIFDTFHVGREQIAAHQKKTRSRSKEKQKTDLDMRGIKFYTFLKEEEMVFLEKILASDPFTSINYARDILQCSWSYALTKGLVVGPQNVMVAENSIYFGEVVKAREEILQSTNLSPEEAIEKFENKLVDVFAYNNLEHNPLLREEREEDKVKSKVDVISEFFQNISISKIKGLTLILGSIFDIGKGNSENFAQTVLYDLMIAMRETPLRILFSHIKKEIEKFKPEQVMDLYKILEKFENNIDDIEMLLWNQNFDNELSTYYTDYACNYYYQIIPRKVVGDIRAIYFDASKFPFHNKKLSYRENVFFGAPVPSRFLYEAGICGEKMARTIEKKALETSKLWLYNNYSEKGYIFPFGFLYLNGVFFDDPNIKAELAIREQKSAENCLSSLKSGNNSHVWLDSLALYLNVLNSNKNLVNNPIILEGIMGLTKTGFVDTKTGEEIIRILKSNGFNRYAVLIQSIPASNAGTRKENVQSEKNTLTPTTSVSLTADEKKITEHFERNIRNKLLFLRGKNRRASI